MKSYRDDKYFLEMVEKKYFLGVKAVLTGMIQRIKGDKKIIDEAIEYAKSKGAFEWEKDDNRKVLIDFNSIKDEYIYKNEILAQNFSEERYEEVLKLCKKVYSKQNTVKEKTKRIGHKKIVENNGIFNTDSDQGLRNARIAIIITILVIIVILAKIF